MPKMRRMLAKSLLSLLVFGLLCVVLLSGGGAAEASCRYRMTSVIEVGAGTTNNSIGSLVISMDPITASSSVGDFVILNLPASPPGYRLQIGNYRLWGASGSLDVTRLDQVSYKVYVHDLSPGDVDAVSFTLPLVIDVPGGVSGPIELKASASPTSVFTSTDSISLTKPGIGIIRVAPNSQSFGSIAVDASSPVEEISVANAGFL